MSEGIEDTFGGIQRIPKPLHTAEDEYSFEEIGTRLTGLFINHRLNCIFADFLLTYKHQETERRLYHETELFLKQRISIFFRIKFLPWLYLLWKK